MIYVRKLVKEPPLLFKSLPRRIALTAVNAPVSQVRKYGPDRIFSGSAVILTEKAVSSGEKRLRVLWGEGTVMF